MLSRSADAWFTDTPNICIKSERFNRPSQNNRNSMNSRRCSTPQRKLDCLFRTLGFIVRLLRRQSEPVPEPRCNTPRIQKPCWIQLLESNQSSGSRLTITRPRDPPSTHRNRRRLSGLPHLAVGAAVGLPREFESGEQALVDTMAACRQGVQLSHIAPCH